jgi:hypothetical protein
MFLKYWPWKVAVLAGLHSTRSQALSNQYKHRLESDLWNALITGSRSLVSGEVSLRHIQLHPASMMHRFVHFLQANPARMQI